MADKPRVTDLPRRSKPLTQPLIPRAQADELVQKFVGKQRDKRRQRRAEAEKRKEW